jgi:hypothetical protein
VLASIAALALLDLGPTAAAQFASAKRAVMKNNGPDARSWRNAVRFKIFGQLGSLLWMAGTSRPNRVLGGAACLMATNLCFWVVCGGARYRHDLDGTLAPIPKQVLRDFLTADAVLFIIAAAATVSPVGSRRMSILSKFMSVGIIVGVIENVPRYVATLPVLLGMKSSASRSTSSAPEPPPADDEKGSRA